MNSIQHLFTQNLFVVKRWEFFFRIVNLCERDVKSWEECTHSVLALAIPSMRMDPRKKIRAIADRYPVTVWERQTRGNTESGRKTIYPRTLMKRTQNSEEAQLSGAIFEDIETPLWESPREKHSTHTHTQNDTIRSDPIFSLRFLEDIWKCCNLTKSYVGL